MQPYGKTRRCPGSVLDEGFVRPGSLRLRDSGVAATQYRPKAFGGGMPMGPHWCANIVTLPIGSNQA
jgi:hypothetical protein